MSEPVVLVTGAARRVGAVIARTLHGSGYRVAIHYRHSEEEARSLCHDLCSARPGSAAAFAADLDDPDAPQALVAAVLAHFGRVDALVNNASSFFPTPIGSVTTAQWDALMTANARAPFFLAQAAAGELRARSGAVVNIVDIYGERPLPRFPAYSISKAALRMATLALADALAPEVRVNAIAPGAILWPSEGKSDEEVSKIIERVPMKQRGTPEDVADAVLWLLMHAKYTTGHTFPIDGGRIITI